MINTEDSIPACANCGKKGEESTGDLKACKAVTWSNIEKWQRAKAKVKGSLHVELIPLLLISFDNKNIPYGLFFEDNM